MNLVWRPISTGRNSTRMICEQCRTEISKKCRQELSCERECEQEILESSESDNEYSDRILDSDGNAGEGETMDSGVLLEVDEEGGVAPTTASVHVEVEPTSTKYMPKGPKRSFMYCSAERRKTQQLVDLIETVYEDEGALLFYDPEGTLCSGTVRDGEGLRTKCTAIRVHSDRDKPRKNTLVTLNHGTICIVEVDWICLQCRHFNRYVGYDHGIFPASSGISFTTELTYYWLSDMCSNTRSFRSVYRSTRRLQFTASYDRRYETSRMSKMSGIHKK